MDQLFALGNVSNRNAILEIARAGISGDQNEHATIFGGLRARVENRSARYASDPAGSPHSRQARKLRSHSITSSARASSAGGTLRPSVLAVWALMTSSNLVDCTTGRSAGFAPLRMRPV